ncbi:hypothetical protein [Rhodovulum sp. MB263]|uniref:hypothetical protein n=1 Tax=Rhodovulum sp. (strain MB263) TaxID=308754 RepID=UPI0009B7E0CF|nr:hypothetical protein [Rhodovulum sp. MB263]ARC88150.1 hypothetical protein B5V46_05760 [Rhodovulum sp. MB263]
MRWPEANLPRAALLALAVPLCFPALAGNADPAFPATDCAALWQATASFRASYAIAEGAPSEARAMARAFRDAGLPRSGLTAAGYDARIARLRPVYLLLLENHILNGSRSSRDQYLRLSGLCDAFARSEGLPGHPPDRRTPLRTK